MEGHPVVRRLSVDETRLVEDLTRKNVMPRDIMSTLKGLNEKNVSTVTTIYNAQQNMWKHEQAGKTLMQVLMNLLHTNNYVYDLTTGDANELENLFFVLPTSRKIWRAFPHVLIIDATYKTNKYNKLFVEIVGVTSTQKILSIAFAFIDRERVANYTWVLNCLKSTLDRCMHPRVIITERELALINACEMVFPDATRLLCRWHIDQNVINYSNKCITSQHDRDSFRSLWKLLVESPTWIAYTGNYGRLQSMLMKYPRVLSYLERTWLDNYKEMFVSAWVDQHLNFGNRTPIELRVNMQSESIPLDSIDIFWRKLDISDTMLEVDDDICCDDKLERFNESFNKQSKVGKQMYLGRLTGIYDPHTTDVREPTVQKNIRGRPSVKKQQKKHANPLNQAPHRCSFSTRSEFMGFDLNKEPERHSYSYEVDLDDEPQSEYQFLMKSILDVFHDYIDGIQNVIGDGSCGFRAVAVCVGYNEDQWPYIRQQLLEELQSKSDAYLAVFTSDFPAVHRSLSWFSRAAPTEYWMHDYAFHWLPDCQQVSCGRSLFKPQTMYDLLPSLEWSCTDSTPSINYIGTCTWPTLCIGVSQRKLPNASYYMLLEYL